MIIKLEHKEYELASIVLRTVRRITAEMLSVRRNKNVQ